MTLARDRDRVITDPDLILKRVATGDVLRDPETFEYYTLGVDGDSDGTCTDVVETVLAVNGRVVLHADGTVHITDAGKRRLERIKAKAARRATRERSRPTNSAERLEPHRAQIEAWFAAGQLDKQIAAALRVGVNVVREARTVWGVASGWAVRRQQHYGNTEIRAELLEQVEAGTAGFKQLRFAERIELWRRHKAAADGTDVAVRRAFAKQYGVRYDMMKMIVEVEGGADLPIMQAVA